MPVYESCPSEAAPPERNGLSAHMLDFENLSDQERRVWQFILSFRRWLLERGVLGTGE
jgi:hypothetical protein